MPTTRPPGPDKRYGQHFLTDLRVVDKTVNLLDLSSCSCIVEIGPGRGALTKKLLKLGKPVIAVETDARLAGFLRELFGSDLKLYERDILKVSADTLLGLKPGGRPPRKRAVLIGNLPYNLSGPILGWIFDSAKYWSQAVLTLQLEVVRRLVARPESRDFGPLAVACALHFTAAKKHIIRPGAFFPPPRVQSAIVDLRRNLSPPIRPKDSDHFMKFVHVLFGHRRKNMRNNIKLNSKLDDDTLNRVFNHAGVDGRDRAEQLTWDMLSQLYRAFLPYDRNRDTG